MHDEIKGPLGDEESRTFIDGIDFYFEDGLMVLTRKYLLDGGFCCDSGCRHCPYDETPEGQG